MIRKEGLYAFVFYRNLIFPYIYSFPKLLIHLHTHTWVSQVEPLKYTLLISDMSGHIQQRGEKIPTRKNIFLRGITSYILSC